jgi:uroporphyrinogen-III decarboxylase
MEVKRFKELYPNTTIASPIDCQNLLTTGTKDDVAKACWKLIEDANDERVLLGSTSEIHPAVPVENAMTMYDILRNYKKSTE